MNRRLRNILIAGGALGGIVVAGTACNNSPQATDQNTSSAILKQFQTAQPAPHFSWSQYRQTLIDIETAQSHTTQTTTFFFNLGEQSPVDSCPSIGFPIASTSQITNPQQNNSGAVLSQIDPTGVYTGDSTGTYVVCVDPNGNTSLRYWEGYAYTTSGPAVWDSATGKVKLVGPSSVNLKLHK